MRIFEAAIGLTIGVTGIAILGINHGYPALYVIGVLFCAGGGILIGTAQDPF